jgi:electron transfer flavoprotein beta subunit
VTVAACLKWVDLRPEVDPLSGFVDRDVRSTDMSDADQAALEWALRAGSAWGEPVLAVTAGPAGASVILRHALAAGAASATLIDVVPDSPSEVVAASLADCLRGCRLVVCGDQSLDRGSGAVPAYLAAHLEAAQALGLVAVELGEPGVVTALRRLDGGRRERLRVSGRAVCSVEGSTARLRRAPLAAVLAARMAAIDARPGPVHHPDPPRPTRPYRPRARALAAPHGDTALDRVRELTATAGVTSRGQPEALEPAAAAERLLAALVTWGYRPG